MKIWSDLSWDVMESWIEVFSKQISSRKRLTLKGSFDYEMRKLLHRTRTFKNDLYHDQSDRTWTLLMITSFQRVHSVIKARLE